MMEHLGGPEGAEKIEERHGRFLGEHGEGPAKMFKVVETATGASVGSVGYWERESHEGQVFETGWMVLPEFQGRGIATEATRQVIDLCRAERTHRYLYAYPSVTTSRRKRFAASSASSSSTRRSTSTRRARATSCAATTGGSTSRTSREKESFLYSRAPPNR
jgi:GNAT superfamily N-acetyltransferase